MTDEGASGKHILLLDDEEAILLPTAKYFRGLGCTVDMAREPEEAEALISHRRYDLVILDLRVTRFGGAEGLEVVRLRTRSVHLHDGLEVNGEAARLQDPVEEALLTHEAYP